MFCSIVSSFLLHFICNDIVGATVGLTEGLDEGFGDGRALGLTVLASVDGAAVGLCDGNDEEGPVFVCVYVDILIQTIIKTFNNNNFFVARIEPEDEGIVLLGFDEVGRLDGATLGWSVGCDDGCSVGFEKGW